MLVALRATSTLMHNLSDPGCKPQSGWHLVTAVLTANCSMTTHKIGARTTDTQPMSRWAFKSQLASAYKLSLNGCRAKLPDVAACSLPLFGY